MSRITKYKHQLRNIVENQKGTRRILVKIYWLLIGFMQILLYIIEELEENKETKNP